MIRTGLLDSGLIQNALCRSNPMVLQVHKRFRKVKAPKVPGTQLALNYFDIAYPPIYGGRWPSIRLGLLCKPKYISVVNNFGDSEKTYKMLKEYGAIDIRPKYNAGVELFNAIKYRQSSQSSSDSENESAHTSEESNMSKTIRPSLIKYSDDELAARAAAKEVERYPEEYRRRALAQNQYVGEVEMDPRNRIIHASQIGNEEALMMDYVPATKLQGLENWLEETDVLKEANLDGKDIGIQKEIQEEPIELPHMLKVFTFFKGDISHFPHPKSDSALGVQDHYPLDGASLLPVLALDLQPGDKMLDLCAAPGGKSLIALQTLLLDHLVCNDVSLRRIKRLMNVMEQYIPKGVQSAENMMSIKMEDGLELSDKDAYDKVLVDVPCLTDRHSLEEDDNNIFAPKRTKERLRLPEIQSQLLMSAIQAVRPGGTVVYSTCTLSPIQNDGVVHLALSRIWEETVIECSVVDMTRALHPLSFLYRFGNALGLRYGQIVLPTVLNNFGPMYFAKIKRIK